MHCSWRCCFLVIPKMKNQEEDIALVPPPTLLTFPRHEISHLVKTLLESTVCCRANLICMYIIMGSNFHWRQRVHQQDLSNPWPESKGRSTHIFLQGTGIAMVRYCTWWSTRPVFTGYMWFQMFSLNIDPGGDFIIRPLSPRDTVYTGLGKPSIHLLTLFNWPLTTTTVT